MFIYDFDTVAIAIGISILWVSIGYIVTGGPFGLKEGKDDDGR